MKYRFQWTAPIAGLAARPEGRLPRRATCSSAPPTAGRRGTPISPDLTRNDKSKQKWSGGPITGDNTGVEIYCTIFAIAESPKQKGLIWAGSDDGLVHVTTRRRQELDERDADDARLARVGHGQHASSRRRTTPAPPTSSSTPTASTTCGRTSARRPTTARRGSASTRRCRRTSTCTPCARTRSRRGHALPRHRARRHVLARRRRDLAAAAS